MICTVWCSFVFLREAQPCIGKRICCFNIQPEEDDKVSFLITGNTWSFRQRLDAFGVALGYTGDDQQRKYYRLLQSQDLTNEEHRSSLAKKSICSCIRWLVGRPICVDLQNMRSVCKL